MASITKRVSTRVFVDGRPEKRRRSPRSVIAPATVTKQARRRRHLVRKATHSGGLTRSRPLSFGGTRSTRTPEGHLRAMVQAVVGGAAWAEGTAEPPLDAGLGHLRRRADESDYAVARRGMDEGHDSRDRSEGRARCIYAAHPLQLRPDGLRAAVQGAVIRQDPTDGITPPRVAKSRESKHPTPEQVAPRSRAPTIPCVRRRVRLRRPAAG